MSEAAEDKVKGISRSWPDRAFQSPGELSYASQLCRKVTAAFEIRK